MLKLPPLRERGEDAKVIAANFIEKINRQKAGIISNYIPKTLAKDTLDFISKYSWPGNIRELYHTIQRACIWFPGELIKKDDFIKFLTEPSSGKPVSDEVSLLAESPVKLDEIARDLKKKYIIKALEITNHNKAESARLLGYKNYQTLSNEMKRLKIK